MHSADSDQEFPGKTFSSKAFSEDEKFELLSAYLDGEVTEAEYQLVIGWIASDQKIAQHYQQQLKLRQALQSLGPTFLGSARASKHLSSEYTAASDQASEGKPQQNQFSRNVYTPRSPVHSQPAIHYGQIFNSQTSNQPSVNRPTIAICDLAASNSWRQGLLVLAVLGAAAMALSTVGLTNRRRPVIHLNRFKEPLSGQTPQKPKAVTVILTQHAHKAPLVSSIQPAFTNR